MCCSVAVALNIFVYTSLHSNTDILFQLATDKKTQSANQNINTLRSLILFFFFGPVENSSGSQQVGGDDRLPIFLSAYKI